MRTPAPGELAALVAERLHRETAQLRLLRLLRALSEPSSTTEVGEELTEIIINGERAMGAASLLECAGHRDLAVLLGGQDDWAKATGHTLDTGP